MISYSLAYSQGWATFKPIIHNTPSQPIQLPQIPDLYPNYSTPSSSTSNYVSERVATKRTYENDWSEWRTSSTTIYINDDDKTLKIYNSPNISLRFEGFKKHYDEETNMYYVESNAKDQYGRNASIVFVITSSQVFIYITLSDNEYLYALKKKI